MVKKSLIIKGREQGSLVSQGKEEEEEEGSKDV